MNDKWKTILRWLPGTAISLILVGVIMHYLNLKAIWLAFQEANYYFLSLALMGSISWFMIRTMVWKTLLQDKSPYWTTYFSLNEGYLMNNFLPFRLGEIGRAFLISRKTKLPFMEVVPTIVIERVLDLLFSAGIFILAVPFVLGVSSAERIVIIVAGVLVVGLIGLFFLVRNRSWAERNFEKISFHWPIIQKNGGSLLTSFFEGLGALSSPQLFIRFLFWMSLAWMLGIIQYFLLLRAFFDQATLPWAMFCLGAAAFGGALPSLPGGIGTMDAAVGGAIALFTNDLGKAAAFVLMLRIFGYFVSGVPAIIALSREGQTLKSLYKDVSSLQIKKNKAQGVE
jgi:uncharacterized protein (TIRG00374 family)